MAASAFGLAIAFWVFHTVGLGALIEAVRRIGWNGALLYLLYSLAVFLLLGAAWQAVAIGEPPRRIWLFAWARMVREGVADLLPFSQLGGLVAGSRILIGQSVTSARVYASMIADMTTELASQLLFTAFGLATMLSLLMDGRMAALRSAAFGGAAALALIILTFILGQRPLIGLASRLAHRILPSAALALDAIDQELEQIYRRPGRVTLSFLFNLAGWTASAAGAWLLLRLIGAPLPLLSVLAIESLIFTVRSVAFLVPGALGFQEAAYVLIAPLFGLSPETALALSLAKRARDVAIGVPTLLAWQLTGVRASFASRRV